MPSRFWILALFASAILLFPYYFALAHVPFGEYAGTHAVAFVPEPKSPFAGEKVEMVFYMRDLHGAPAKEPFVVETLIQKILENDEELGIFGTKGETITSGVYRTSYAFAQPGSYRVDFIFWKPDEPEITRDAVFDIGVRKPPLLTANSVAVLVLAGLAAFLGGRFSRPKR